MINPEELKKKTPSERLEAMKMACDADDKAACRLLDRTLYGGLLSAKEVIRRGRLGPKLNMGLIGQIINEGNKTAIWQLKESGLWNDKKKEILDGIEKKIADLKKREKALEERGFFEKAEETEDTIKNLEDILSDEIVESMEPEEIRKGAEYARKVTEEAVEKAEKPFEAVPKVAPEKPERIKRLEEIEEEIKKLREELGG